ncbi:MAG: hypothetical protein BGO27_01465 [Alphaproteobacteria bacterium 33-17]|nr:MAG: hypothetical protein BGO27_01465 [Alphaproteobacteria bacterium 33-17]
MFVVTSEIMMGLMNGKHNFRYIFFKAAFIIFIGAITDLIINKTVPFEGFDILYLIGYALPVTYLVRKWNNKAILILIILILIASPYLRQKFGYEDLVFNIANFSTLNIIPKEAAFKSWFINGWFPMFPWLAFMLSGLIVGKIYKNYEALSKDYFQSPLHLLAFSWVLMGGIVILAISPSDMPNRNGYHCIFYPATTGIFIALLGATGILMHSANYIKHLKFSKRFIHPIGRSSLAIYPIHLIYINNILEPIFGKMDSIILFSITYIIHLMLLRLTVFLFDLLKSRSPSLPSPVYWLIGR